MKISYILICFIYIFTACGGSKKNDDTQQTIKPLNECNVIIVHSYHDTVGGVIKKNQILKEILDEYKINYDFIYLDTR